ncbi:MAG: phosphodiester glycosidase family protein [Candidatus Sericytochromatia bacterium]|nr:phosphodiester glycosidase family protein [Candidatus Sericytochromatia bacterium]
MPMLLPLRRVAALPGTSPGRSGPASPGPSGPAPAGGKPAGSPQPPDAMVVMRRRLGGMLRPLDAWAPTQAQRATLAPGVTLDRTRRTANGAVVTVVAIAAGAARLEASFDNGVRTLSPDQVRRVPGLLAAVNAAFFGFGATNGTYGDLAGLGRTYRDETLGSAYDGISDRRWHLAVGTDGQPRFRRGGLSELEAQQPAPPGFVGGLGRLYGEAEVATLSRDVANGAFLRRLRAGVSDRSFPNVDLTSPVARTLVGRKPDGSLLLVTAGQGSERGRGAGFAEAALLMRSLGAVEAYTLDGGGSTHVIAPGAVETRSDGRAVKSYWVVREPARQPG